MTMKKIKLLIYDNLYKWYIFKKKFDQKKDKKSITDTFWHIYYSFEMHPSFVVNNALIPPICRDNPWTNEWTDERSDIMSCLSQQKYYPKFFFRDHFISMKKEHIDWKCHWYHENREFQLTHKDRDYNESMLLFIIYIKSMMKVCYYLP